MDTFIATVSVGLQLVDVHCLLLAQLASLSDSWVLALSET